MLQHLNEASEQAPSFALQNIVRAQAVLLNVIALYVTAYHGGSHPEIFHTHRYIYIYTCAPISHQHSHPSSILVDHIGEKSLKVATHRFADSPGCTKEWQFPWPKTPGRPGFINGLGWDGASQITLTKGSL